MLLLNQLEIKRFAERIQKIELETNNPESRDLLISLRLPVLSFAYYWHQSKRVKFGHSKNWVINIADWERDENSQWILVKKIDYLSFESIQLDDFVNADINEYLQNKLIQESSELILSLDNWFLMIDLTDKRFDFKQIKGVKQNFIYTQNYIIPDIKIWEIDIGMKELLKYSIFLNPSKLILSLTYLISHSTYLEDFMKLMDILFDKCEQEENQSWCFLNIKDLKIYFNQCRSTKYFYYFLEKLKSNTSISNLEALLRWTDDVLRLQESVKSHSSLRKIRLSCIVESNMKNLFSKIKKFNKNNKIHIEYISNKFNSKIEEERTNDKYGFEIIE